MVKAPPTALLKRKADAAFSIYIRRRDKGVCFTCGVKKPWKKQQCGHFISRQYLWTRWDETNNHCQCVGCNIFKNGNYVEYTLRMQKKYGDETVKKLNQSKYKIRKMTVQDYLNIIELYETKNKNF